MSEQDFEQIIGVKKQTFNEMLGILSLAYEEKHKRRGRHTKLSLEDQLFMNLKYWRQYVTQKELAYEFEVGEATAHDTIVWVENVLVQSGKFSLPGKKALCEDAEIEIVLVDVKKVQKKNSGSGTQAKRSGNHKDPAHCESKDRGNHLYCSCRRLLP